MKKITFIKSVIFAAVMLCITPLFAQAGGKQNKVTVELSNVTTTDGLLLVAVYDSEKAFSKKSACLETKINPANGKTVFDVELPDGDYLFCIAHDVNNNGKLDEGLFGMPKEPVAMNNYNGKNVPKFSKLKVSISADSTIPMELFSF